MNSLLSLLIPVAFLWALNAGQSINFGTFASHSDSSEAPPRTAGIESEGIDDPNYGITWAFMPDGVGVLQVAYLTPPEDDFKRTFTDLSSVYFHLFTREGESDRAYQVEGVEEIFTNFDPSKPTKIFAHGWMSREDVEVVAKLREQYLKNEDVNVIMVDWRMIANNMFYVGSARGAQDVGVYLGQLIDYMVERMGASTEQMHIIGQSLGAHLAGFAASNLTSGTISRISGLDPAGPGFFLRGPNMRLDPTDADFVDVIHTAAGTFGHFANLGHVDFYPNGGVKQPNCTIASIQKMESCSHGRALDYFTESIGNDNFYGYNCRNFEDLQNCVCDTRQFEKMGEHVSRTASGIYYVQVGSEENYAQGPIEETAMCVDAEEKRGQ